MATKIKRERYRFTDNLIDYLQKTDYRIAGNDFEKNRIYKFRYDAYVKEGEINENSSKIFTDDYDQMDNCWNFGLFFDDKLVSALRIHIITPEEPMGPAYDVFPDIVRPMIERGDRIVDPTRFVADSTSTNFFPILPYLTFRLPCMASDHFDADYMLITVREDHATFYERSFKVTRVCEPRPYPQLRMPICLLRANVTDLWDGLIERFPMFRSTFSERRMMFTKPQTIVEPVVGGKIGKSTIIN